MLLLLVSLIKAEDLEEHREGRDYTLNQDSKELHSNSGDSRSFLLKSVKFFISNTKFLFQRFGVLTYEGMSNRMLRGKGKEGRNNFIIL